MATGTQVDHLFWAVAEARRRRAQEDEQRMGSDVLARSASGLDYGFVTEWQTAEAMSPAL